MSSVDYFVGYAIELGSVQYVCAKGFNYLESSIEILSCVIWFAHYFFVFSTLSMPVNIILLIFAVDIQILISMFSVSY